MPNASPHFPISEEIVHIPSGPELHVEHSGESEKTLAVLHGGPGLSCEYLAPLHSLAGPQRSVMMFDQAGGGRSNDIRPPEAVTVDVLVADLVELLDALGLKSVDLLGHSFGVILALQFAIDHPHRVDSLILANGSASVPRLSGGFIAQLLEQQGPEAVGKVLSTEVRGQADADYWAIVGAFLERGSFAASDQLPDDQAADSWRLVFESISDVGRALWGPWQFTATGSARDWDVIERLDEIRVPVLTTSGTDDYVRTSDVQHFTRAIPDAQYLCVGDGHEGFLTGPAFEIFQAAVESFLHGATSAAEISTDRSNAHEATGPGHDD